LRLSGSVDRERRLVRITGWCLGLGRDSCLLSRVIARTTTAATATAATPAAAAICTGSAFTDALRAIGLQFFGRLVSGVVFFNGIGDFCCIWRCGMLVRLGLALAVSSAIAAVAPSAATSTVTVAAV
jgi:hypothetical protein